MASRKRVERAAQRKAARQLSADTLDVLRLCWADEEADEFNLADRLVEERGVYAYLQMKALAQTAVEALAKEWNVTPDEALERIAPRRRRRSKTQSGVPK